MDWPPQPLYNCAPGTDTYVKGPIIFVGVAGVIVVLAERKLTSYVYAVVTACARRVDTELVSEQFPVIRFHSLPAIATIISHRGSPTGLSGQPMLGSRCTIMVDDAWGASDARSHLGAFSHLVIARFGPVPDEGADEPYRDPEIYRAMHLERYFSYVADWHTYP
ncbi:hypothetical protein TIFTF001_046185 [Ficus carica]|uniref:Uncharacterized protein n=1 Tax=Ficus carica TaxID=3494 RepID=A0AA87Z3D2_FICCA|nr:hypothetical protein TIFTF001_046185 [Ficus carica]